VGFELRKSLFDGVQIGRVLRQEQEPCAALSQDFGGLGAFVHREIVKNDDITASQRRGQLGGDIGVEGDPVHRTRDHPRCGEAVTSQTGNECLRTPAPKWRTGPKPRSTPAAASEAGHLGVYGRLVDKDQACRIKSHPGLAPADPDPPLVLDILASALRGHQRFFYKRNQPCTAPAIEKPGARAHHARLQGYPKARAS